MDKKLKKKYMKTGLIVLAVIVVSGGLMMLGLSDQFQGMIGKKPALTPFKPGAWQVYKDNYNKAVSPVVSPVPTVTASPVPSQVGPSIVISQVPSAIITPVTSGVPLTAKDAAKYNLKSLPQLTASVLKEAAKQDLTKNPQKYRLTNDQKRSMIEMYMRNLKK
jgi:hypothetical protein